MKKKKEVVVPNCRVCNSRLRFVLPNIYHSTKGIIDLYGCSVCGSKFEVSSIQGEKIIIKKREDIKSSNETKTHPKLSIIT